MQEQQKDVESFRHMTGAGYLQIGEGLLAEKMRVTPRLQGHTSLIWHLGVRSPSMFGRVVATFTPDSGA